MNEIPLSDASMSEVLARVAYRLIVRRLSRLPCDLYPTREVVSDLYGQLEKRGWTALSAWVSAYAFYLAQGEIPAFTRTRFIFRARLGYDFRSVMYADYKATRRDPPVSNTGVRGRRTRRRIEQ